VCNCSAVREKNAINFIEITKCVHQNSVQYVKYLCVFMQKYIRDILHTLHYETTGSSFLICTVNYGMYAIEGLPS
jgi:hypothetical protein